MGVVFTLLAEGIWRTQGGIILYLSILASLTLFANCLYRNQFRFTYFDLFMMAAFVLHWLLSSDKFSSMILMMSTLLLYQSTLRLNFSICYIIYPLLFIFFASIILTAPALLHSLASSHASRANLYAGFFQNPNSDAAFLTACILMAYICIRQRKLKYAVYIVGMIALLSTGSRNALLTLLLTAFFSIVARTRLKRWCFAMFVGVLVTAFVYMVVFELSSAVSFTMMGKEANSAGRAQQILSVMMEYPVNLFGNGREEIDLFSLDENGYAVHNFYVSSLYSFGIFILAGYLWFIYKVWRKLDNRKSAAVWLAFNVYFFFEPGVCFYYKFLNVFPLLIVLISADGRQTYFKPITFKWIKRLNKALTPHNGLRELHT